MSYLKDVIVKGYANSILDHEYLQFLNLSGRQAFWKQGYFGENAIVGVIDTGIDENHPELKGKVIDGKSFLRYTTKPIDDYGHGTHVAGTIAGINTGMAPKAKLVNIKVLDGIGDAPSFDTIIDGFEWAGNWKSKDGKRINIISASLGANKNRIGNSFKRFEDVIKWLVNDKKISVICAAGNSYKEEDHWPGSFQDVICVGAVDFEKKKAGFSTWGNQVDVCQIGVDVLSAWPSNQYRILSGTSMATPAVSGIAALLADKFEALFKEQIHDDLLYWLLKMNTKDIDVPGVDKNTGAGFCSLQPIEMDLHTHIGDTHMTNNGKRIELRAPIAVVPPGVTSLPAREFIELFGGAVYWNQGTQFANFRV